MTVNRIGFRPAFQVAIQVLCGRHLTVWHVTAYVKRTLALDQINWILARNLIGTRVEMDRTDYYYYYYYYYYKCHGLQCCHHTVAGALYKN